MLSAAVARYTHPLPNTKAHTNLHSTKATERGARFPTYRQPGIMNGQDGASDLEGSRNNQTLPLDRNRESSTPPIFPPGPPSNAQQQSWAAAWGGQGGLNPWQYYNQYWQWYGSQPINAQYGSSFGQLPYRPFQGQVAQPGDPDSLELQQDEYGTLRVVRPHTSKRWRVDKTSRFAASQPQSSKPTRSQRKKAKQAMAALQSLQGVPSTLPNQTQPQQPQSKNVEALQPKQVTIKGKEPKIMLPAPQPTAEYLAEANEAPVVVDPPQRILVILDLNGTLIYRPNRKQPKRFLARPYLEPFLRYLFDNFSVMVWSSARPENVNSLVENALDPELRSKLVDIWTRDDFNLTSEHYNANVQVYKDLTKVWSADRIQSKMPSASEGLQFGQHNTILIDDSALKASAQPHNLLEIPEFAATQVQMTSDILKEVAGYLEIVRMQDDVSSFMRKWPFKADGTWTREWWELSATGVDAEKEGIKQDVK